MAIFALLAGAAWLDRAVPALATVSGSPCPGNVCSDTLIVGGQAVNYSYTQHLAPNGQLRIRLNGGVYGTSQLVSYIVSGLPSFSAWDKLANPAGAIFLPEEDVNPGRTAYERRSTGGVSGQVVDQVMSVAFSGLAPGTYTFDLTVIQHGATGGKSGLTFYVDAAAPGNGDESFAWGAVPGMDLPCADGADNDLDFLADCADAQCAGAVGEPVSGARCEAPEATCNDLFDNDGDGAPDCADLSCNGRVGDPVGTALCQAPDEFGLASCADGFDNDGDGKQDCLDNDASDALPNHACWKQASYGCPAVEDCTSGADDDKDMSFSDAYDALPLTGVNCLDYDCQGHPSCPAQENRDADGRDADEQCFDGVDNDLDTGVDCADPDCVGVTHPSIPGLACHDKEFDLGAGFQYCANVFDDDGDGPADCADSDCARRFGNCGPCPAREDFTYDACADAADNDTDGAAGCADTDCLSRFGETDGAAYCAAAENTDDLCSDLFDNDLDGDVDCADSQCAGRLGPQGQACQPAGETSCGDGADNDLDGARDCADDDCWGVGSCAAQSYVEAACQTIPGYLGPTAFTGNDPTVLATVTVKQHVGASDVIRLTGSGTYSSVTVIVGDNTDADAYYPYAAATCELLDTATMTPAARFAFLAVTGHAVQIYNTAGPNIAGFDLTFRCATPGVPASRRDYPISLSALKQPGDLPEYGDAAFSTTLYEATPPVVSEVEAEGESGGVIRVPYGAVSSPEGRRFRAVASDPGGPSPFSSGICSAEVRLQGGSYVATYTTTADGLTAPLAFSDDDALKAMGQALDGANNSGAWSVEQNFTVNVTPAVTSPLALSPARPFFRGTAPDVLLSAEYATATSDTFNATCDVFVRNASGIIVNGPVGPTASFPGVALGNTLRCFGTVALPAVPDGTYFFTVRATDGDGDSVTTARSAGFYCENVPAYGEPDPGNGCIWADFDADGSAEGLYTTLYSAEARACDNCVGLPNPSQDDANANGLGDVCEPTDVFGRCEIDREIVCGCDSDELCDYPCPGPSIGEDADGNHVDPQRCRESWGLCVLQGQVCFDDNECPGGPGFCSDDATACRRDIDCDNAGVPGPCRDADYCENMLHPWLQTVYGNIFSRKKITAPEAAPQNQFNATYCITAKDTITNFSSELCGTQVDAASRYELPRRSNLYSTVLGRIDVDGLRAGRYGEVVEVASGNLDATLASYAGHLGGRVFRVVGDAQLAAHMIMNDATDGSGTVFVDGGNLTLLGDLDYDGSTALTPRGLASLGLIVLDDGSSLKGNVYVGKDVTRLVGAFYAGGDEGVWSVAPPDTDSDRQLVVYGLMLARQFHFSRSYKSMVEGAERIIYDGRAVANPPPGFGDLGRALPRFGE